MGLPGRQQELVTAAQPMQAEVVLPLASVSTVLLGHESKHYSQGLYITQYIYLKLPVPAVSVSGTSGEAVITHHKYSDPLQIEITDIYSVLCASIL